MLLSMRSGDENVGGPAHPSSCSLEAEAARPWPPRRDGALQPMAYAQWACLFLTQFPLCPGLDISAHSRERAVLVDTAHSNQFYSMYCTAVMEVKVLQDSGLDQAPALLATPWEPVHVYSCLWPSVSSRQKIKDPQMALGRATDM